MGPDQCQALVWAVLGHKDDPGPNLVELLAFGENGWVTMSIPSEKCRWGP